MADERDAGVETRYFETAIELANGDALAERLAKVGLDADGTCSIEELRQRLGL